MNWKKVLKSDSNDYTVMPKGLKPYNDWHTTEQITSKDYWDNSFIFTNVSFVKELKEITEALEKLGMKVSYTALYDTRYGHENNDGLYNWNEKSGMGMKIQRKGVSDLTLYFVIDTDGAYTEEGGKPDVWVPRVLQQEDVFIAVVMEALGMGDGPTKDNIDPKKEEELMRQLRAEEIDFNEYRNAMNDMGFRIRR
tara:strand:- start:1502 stop:2086 length:585 start_codon:yes stop_codon:yes gene_type:complete